MLKTHVLIFLLSTLAVVFAEGESDGLWSFPIETMHGRRLSESNGQHANPYAGFGMHFVPIYFGNPAQLRTLAVSTSEAYTAMPCEDCARCSRGANLYNFTQSTGFVECGQNSPPCSSGFSCFNGRCMFGKQIRDGSSFTGYEIADVAYDGGARDELIVGTDEALKSGFRLRFICQTTTRGYFNSVMDGVLGLSPANTSFLSQMHSAGKLEHRRFSLCFNGAGVRSGSTGVVTLGGTRQFVGSTAMVFAKKVEGMAYKVNITNIQLRVGGGDSVRVASNDYTTVDVEGGYEVDTTALVDSSEPFLTFDKRFEEPFRAAWRHATGHDFSHARVALTKDEMRKLPTLLIDLEGDPFSSREMDPASVPSLNGDYGVRVAVPPAHYMEHMLADTRPHRARIHFEGEGSIFGASLMQGHTVAYEPDLNRIGFAESRQCQTGRSQGGRNGDGAAVGGSTGETDELDGGTSIATSGGAPTGTAPGTAAAANPGSTVLAGGTDDDLFIAAESRESAQGEDFEGGGCFSASCRSFMAIGYIFVGTALAVVYRVSRPKERIGMKDYHQYTMEEAVQNQDDLSPVYRRKAWNDTGDGGFMA